MREPDWQTPDGAVRLWCGDCMELLPHVKADCVVTDPPYEMRGGGGVVPIYGKGVAPRVHESFAVGEPWGASYDWLPAMLATEPRQACVFCNSYMLGPICTGLASTMTIGAVFVWHKPNAPPNCRNTPKWDCEFIVWGRGKGQTNIRAREFRSQVLSIPFPNAGCMASERILRTDSKRAAHPTQKPLAVVEPFISRLSEPDWTVLDPYMGTATTIEAAIRLGRRAIGIEIDPHYFWDIAVPRIKKALAERSSQLDFKP